MFLLTSKGTIHELSRDTLHHEHSGLLLQYWSSKLILKFKLEGFKNIDR